MKCTSNKQFITLFLSIFIIVSLCGCGKSKIPLDYIENNDISTSNLDNRASGYATNLAVTSGDVSGRNGYTAEEDSTAGLFDVNNSAVLYAKNVHQQMNPASLTKVMTAYCALKYGNLDDMIICSDNIMNLESGASTCGLRPGDRMSLNQALHFLLLPSANDAAIAIAEHISGSVDEFSSLMNKEAQLLGATNSHFVNPHGLTAEEHYTTAYDMYLIANATIRYSTFTEIIQMTDYSTTITDKEGSEKSIEVGTSNKFLDGTYSAPDRITVIGGKTGTTNAAGSCLILVTRDASNNPYISVILHASDRGVLYEQMISLLEEINSK